ncbi:ABC transporter permease [Porphyromonas macacae]|nr:FtsX-like permease family protein [Porphyromonas macacae]
MVLVAGFTMITGLIILLLDNTILIGTLKALGSTNKSIRKVFQNLSAILIIKGLFWGNATALVICFLQSYFNIVKLNPEAYLMDVVPISINIFQWIAINLGALFLILLMTWGPTRIISRINPSETMRFE